MKDKSVAIMRHLSSPSCNSVLNCLHEGLDHPDDISKKLGVVRQTVDWHLLKLSALGVVERDAVSSISGRPKVIYKLTPDGKNLIKSIEQAVNAHFLKMKKKYDKFHHELDIKLARAEISEDVYVEKVRKLKRERRLLESD